MSLLKGLFFTCDWFNVYDLVEFIARVNRIKSRNIDFRNLCNRVFEEYLSGYRFEDTIFPVTSENEIESIKTAIEDTSKLKPVSIHFS